MTKKTDAFGSDLHKYDLEDAAYDITNFHRLLSTINDFVREMPLGTGENRNHELDRVGSLLRVAEDFADHIRERAEA